MTDNVEYGFDPHDDSDYLIIHGNDVWGNGKQPIVQKRRKLEQPTCKVAVVSCSMTSIVVVVHLPRQN